MVQQKEIESFLAVARKDLDQDRVSASTKGLARVLELDPGNPEAHYLMGLALTRARRYEDAEPHLLETLSAEIGFLHAQKSAMLLGYLASERELYEEAAGYFERALRYNFNNDAAYAALGHVHWKLGRAEKAEEALRQALRLNPDNHNARNSLAFILCETDDDIDKALSEALRAAKYDPKNHAYQDTLGWIYHKKGKETLARETLKRALELAPDNEEIKAHLREVLQIA